MTDKLISASIDSVGGVNILRNRDGQSWRVAVSRHDIDALDRHAPEIPAGDRESIISAWSEMPPLEDL